MVTEQTRLRCGRRAVIAALSAGSVRKLWITSGTNADLLARAADDLPVIIFSPSKLTRLARTPNHQGVVALCADAPDHSWQTAIAGVNNPLLVVLDQVQDPRNLGACVRTCAAMGVQAIVHPKRRAVAFTPAASHAAQGGDQFVAIHAVTNLARELVLLRDAGLTLIGTAADAKHSIDDLDIAGPVALVLGGEKKVCAD